MKTTRNSITALLQVVVAIFGWLICLVGLIGIWSLLPRVNNSFGSIASLANRSLDTSIQMLDNIDTTLKNTLDTISQIHTGLGDVSITLGNTSPLFSSAGNMVGKDFAKMTEDTRTALSSLASTAKVIDDTLRVISTIPFIGQPYNPSTPLDTSVTNLANNLEKLPANLTDIQTWLDGTSKDLSTLQIDTAQLAQSIDKVTPQLTAAVQGIAQYRKDVQDLKTQLADLETRISQALSLVAICLTIFLVWIALSQVTGFLQGLERLQAVQIDENIAAEENQVEDSILESGEVPLEDNKPQ